MPSKNFCFPRVRAANPLAHAENRGSRERPGAHTQRVPGVSPEPSLHKFYNLFAVFLDIYRGNHVFKIDK